MARPRRALEPKEPDIADPTPDEAEAQALDPPAQEQGEVHADEFSRGIEQPVGQSALSEEVVEALRQPLDPNRIRRRKGRGAGQFEYIAGHDVKRRANELFGFGNWGGEIIQLEEMASVPVVNDSGKEGWHVAYLCVVRVTVRGCLPVSDVGYGDGVEYGAAAHATARELAIKEASTDALKRAFTQYGDQFGLILYAKGDEKQRIQRENNAEAARSVEPDPVPKSWPEINDWATAYGEDFGWSIWLQQVTAILYGDEKAADRTLLTRAEKSTLGQKAATVIYKLRKEFDPAAFPPVPREAVQREWAAVLDGVAPLGPPWRFTPEETGLPTHGEWEAAQAEADAIDFGGEAVDKSDHPAYATTAE